MQVFLALFLILISINALAAESVTEDQAYWDYGIGLGAVRFEQYPASNEFSILALPAPTFQYRGKILRADDRDGAHLYLLKESRFSLELSGEGTPALDSSNSGARKGMDNLPWMLALGPQLVMRLPNFEFGLGAYQAVTTDFMMTRFAGNIFDARASYSWVHPLSAFSFVESGYTTGKFGLSVKAGTKEFQSLYYEVPVNFSTIDRPAYESRSGLFSRTISYYQSFKSGRMSLYLGGALNSYDISANRQSPLHKSDNNFVAFVGVNYTLGESSRPAVPESETSGVINDYRRNQQLRDNF